MSTHVPSTVNDFQEEQLTPPEWEINSSNVPQNWIDIIGTESSDSRDRIVAYRTGPVNGLYCNAAAFFGTRLKNSWKT